jgi:hypothetical protein
MGQTLLFAAFDLVFAPHESSQQIPRATAARIEKTIFKLHHDFDRHRGAAAISCVIFDGVVCRQLIRWFRQQLPGCSMKRSPATRDTIGGSPGLKLNPETGA